MKRSVLSGFKLRKYIKIFLALNLLFCNFSWASSYKIEFHDRSAIDTITSNGVGAEYDIMNEEDSSIHRIRVLDFEYNSSTQTMSVEFEKAEPGVFSYNFDEVTINGQPAPNSSIEIGSDKNKFTFLNNIGDLSVGLGQGALGAGKHLLLKNSPAFKEIKRYQSQISEHQRAMEKDLKEMEVSREKLFSAVSALAKQARVAPTIPEIDISKLRKLDVSQMLKSSHSGELELTWNSTDTDFVREAEEIKNKLTSVKVRDSLDKEFFNISRASLGVADSLNLEGLVAESGYWLEIAHVAADVLLGLNPFTGVARDIYESLVGKSLISGEPLSDFERGAAMASLITFGFGRHIALGFNALKRTKVFGASYTKALEYVSPLIDLAQDLRITARNQFSELANFVKTFFGQNSGAIAKTKEFIDAAGIGRTNKLLVQARAPRVLDRSVHKLVVRPAEFINATAHAGKVPPYKVGTRVYEFTTDKEIKDHFVRVYSHNRMEGPWIIEKSTIRGKTPSEIKDLLALPVEPSHIVDLFIPPGVAIRKGIVNPIFDSTGNRFSIQYEIAMEKIFDSKVYTILFQNSRSL